MTKNIIIPLTIILSVLPAVSYAKVFDPLARLTYAAEAKHRGAPPAREVQRYHSAILVHDGEPDTAVLRQKGVVVWGTRDNMVLACIPDSAMNTLSDGEGLVTRVAMSRKVNSCLDRARGYSNVDKVQSGEASPMPFSGKGVTVGFSDTGFDHGHVAFSGRVGGISHFIDTLAVRHRIAPDQLDSWTTDTRNAYHATHVAGILAGEASQGSAYTGVAPGADLYASTSILYDVGILAGVDDVIRAAKHKGQPAVVNLSLGSCLGPRDGTDPFCRYLDLCGEEAAIVIAAGNDGSTNCTARAAIEPQKSAAVLINSTDWDHPLNLNGYADLWTLEQHQLVEIRIGVWDILTQKIIAYTPWSQFAEYEGEGLFVLDCAEVESGFEQCYSGTILAAAEENPFNGRYNVTISCNLKSLENFPGGSWSRFSLVVEMGTTAGCTVDVAVEGDIELSSASLPWLTPGCPDNSISALACGSNVIAVGSFTSRHEAPLLRGSHDSWAGFVNEGTVSAFTSYGTTPDGRQLPHVCAPGAYVVSAMSRPFIESHPSYVARMAAEDARRQGNYYFAECGTSMATPHVAGIFALWLEADPTLTPAELRETAVSTANKNFDDIADPRYGAGLIDAAAGLRQILGADGVCPATVGELVEIRREGHQLTISGADATAVKVYSMQGMALDPDNLPDEPVVVIATANGTVVSRKLR